MATDTHERPTATPPRAREASRRPRARSSITLTGRGGVVVVFALTLLGAVSGTLLRLGSAQEVLFVLGCLLAVLATRRTDLLTLVVSPPLVFFAVSLLAAVAGSLGARSFLVGVVLTLATNLTSNVPGLFLGTALVVIVAVPRGLPGVLRELSARVAEDNPFRQRTGETKNAGIKSDRKKDENPVRWDETPGRHAGA